MYDAKPFVSRMRCEREASDTARRCICLLEMTDDQLAKSVRPPDRQIVMSCQEKIEIAVTAREGGEPHPQAEISIRIRVL